MPSVPSLGLFALNMHADGAAALARLGPLAEELGYDSLWTGEHVVVPDPRVAPSPMEPDDPVLDPLVALAFLAAMTKRVRLGTGVIVLPQRNPVVLAKQLASLDVLSGGRLTFGYGVGYLEPEMRAIGVPMEHRGARADEHLAAMRALWEQERPAFAGEFTSFEGVNAFPRPRQRPIPVVASGHSAPAHRRAARHADGWYGFLLDPAQAAEQVGALRAALVAEDRAPDALEITVTPSGRLDAAALAAFAAAGVDRLVLFPPIERPLDELEGWLRRHAPGALG